MDGLLVGLAVARTPSLNPDGKESALVHQTAPPRAHARAKTTATYTTREESIFQVRGVAIWSVMLVTNKGRKPNQLQVVGATAATAPRPNGVHTISASGLRLWKARWIGSKRKP